MRLISDIKEKELDTILSNILRNIERCEDWYSFFPRISGYNYMYPNSYEDIEEYPDSFREDDHAIAAAAVKYSALQDKIVEIVERVTYLNKTSGIIWAEPYEHAGTCFAIELALHDFGYVHLYADFLMSNDMEYENLQSYDTLKIIRKWGLMPEIYYLILAHWFIQGENARSDMDYLTFSTHSLKKNLQDEVKLTQFIDALELFLLKQKISSDELLLQNEYQTLFNDLVDEYIFPEETEKAEQLKNHFPKAVEKLTNKWTAESKLSNMVEAHISLEEDLPEI